MEIGDVFQLASERTLRFKHNQDAGIFMGKQSE